MQTWYHCENTYPFVPQEVLDAAEFGARQPAEPLLRSEDRRRPVPRMPGRAPAVRRSRREHRLDRTPLRDQQPVWRQSDDPRQHRASDQQGAHPQPGHAGHCAARSGARGRGIRHCRCDLARPAGDRLRQVRRQRDGIGQRQPHRYRRTLLGGDRSDREDADQPRRPVQLGGQAFHASPCEHLAALLSASASAALGRDRRSGDIAPNWAGAAWSTRWCCAAWKVPSAPGRPIVRHARKPDCPRLRWIASPIPRSSMSATRTRKACEIGSKLLWFLNTS